MFKGTHAYGASFAWVRACMVSEPGRCGWKSVAVEAWLGLAVVSQWVSVGEVKNGLGPMRLRLRWSQNMSRHERPF